MNSASALDCLEKSANQNPRFILTFLSYILVLVFYVNMTVLGFTVLGVATSVFFFLINSVFLGNAFFKGETAFIRSTLGLLLFVLILGFMGWLAVIIYNLDSTNLTLVLLFVATFSSLSNELMRKKDVNLHGKAKKPSASC